MYPVAGEKIERALTSSMRGIHGGEIPHQRLRRAGGMYPLDHDSVQRSLSTPPRRLPSERRGGTIPRTHPHATRPRRRAPMKTGMNLLLWTSHVTREHFPLLAELKATGFDGVELPIFEGDVAHYSALGKEIRKNG